MIRSRAYSLLLTLMLASPFAVQGQSVQPVTHQQRPLSWVPQGFEVLGKRAAFHTDFTFDRSMLQLAGYFMGDADQQTRNAIAKLDGISVHSYHFAAPGLYNPAALEVIRREYDHAGWKHLVTARGKGDPFNPGQTDLWINFANMNVTGMMVLFTGPRDLNLIALNGAISPLDLLHLRGHFGIPRFSGDGFVPGPSHAARPPYAPPAPDPGDDRTSTRERSGSRAAIRRGTPGKAFAVQLSRRGRRCRSGRNAAGTGSSAAYPSRLLNIRISERYWRAASALRFSFTSK